MPRNIHCQTPQQNRIMRAIRKNLVMQCLGMLKEITAQQEDYEHFYEQYGQRLKLGAHEESTNRTDLAEERMGYTYEGPDDMDEELMCHNTPTSRDESSCPKEREIVHTRYAGTDAPSMTDSSDEFIPAVIRDTISQAIATEMARHTGTSEEIVILAVERAYDTTVSHPFWDQ
eukprot:2205356-Pyramimonas_sp.AAC.1